MRISCEPADSRVEAVGGLSHTVYTTCFLRTAPGFFLVERLLPLAAASPPLQSSRADNIPLSARRNIIYSRPNQPRFQRASPICREPI